MRPTLSTTKITNFGLGIFVLLPLITSVIGLVSPWLTLNENQVLYLFSTTAQVIAAIYGLTITGFLFFRNELTREAIEDETLEEAINELKSRYFRLLIYVTVFVAFTLLVANLVISHESSPNGHVTTVLINVGQSFFAVAFLAITFFVFDVIAPLRVERASRNLQNELDPPLARNEQGSLEVFLRNYNRIENLLAEAGKPYQAYRSNSIQTNRPIRPSNARLAEILFRNEQISSSLHDRLRELITLRNAIIHGADPVVSQGIVDTSAEVLSELQRCLPPQ